VLADGLRAALEKEGIRQPVERAGPAAQPLPMRHAPLQPPQRDDDTPRLPLTTRNPEGDRFDLGVEAGRAQGRSYTMPTAKRPLSAHPDDDPRFERAPQVVADNPQVEPEPLPLEERLPAASPGWKPGATGGLDHRALLPVPRFRDLRVIGQFHDTYVLCEGGGELVIVDQHAAHERVTLHRLRKDREARIGSAQRLLTPEVVELPLAQAALLRDRLDVLRDLRLDVEPFGPAAFAVTGVPLALVGTDLAALLRDLADDLAQNLKGRAGEDVVEQFLATMACHNSVRANQPLTPAEMRALLVSLDEVDVAVCAHGRPVAIRVTAAELEHRFHRT
jgi:DNA mismatch repair protein MutL